MKNKKYYIILLILFAFTVPLLQSLLFSSKSDGVLYVDKEIQADFLQSDKKNILIYFGYVGCADVCTPFLSNLDTIYESDEFKSLREDTEVLFVNLTPDIEPEQADIFAKFFNQHFKGVYLSKQELLRLDRSFDLFFSDSLSETTELNHTDYLYLIDNHHDIKLLKNIYFTHPLRTKKLIDDMINKKVGA